MRFWKNLNCMHSYHKEIIDLVKFPKCGDVLFKEYNSFDDCYKSCVNRVGHKIKIISSADDKLKLIAINIDPMVKVIWNFRSQVIQIQDLNVANILVNSNVPFFDPKLLEYDKLLNKIKTYILLS